MTLENRMAWQRPDALVVTTHMRNKGEFEVIAT